MLTSDLPDLKKEEDIDWVKETLMLELPKEAALKKFQDWIYQSLNIKTALMNDTAHILAQ